MNDRLIEKFITKKINPQINLIEELFDYYMQKCNQEFLLFKGLNFFDVYVCSSYKSFGYNFEKVILSSKNVFVIYQLGKYYDLNGIFLLM